MAVNKKRFGGIIYVVSLILFSFSISAQTTIKESEDFKSVRDFELDSRLMERKMPYRVILPNGYNSSGKKSFPVMYLLHGLGGHFDGWSGKSGLMTYARSRGYIFIMPEGNNGWYTDSESIARDKYESYIVKELIPEIDRKFRTRAMRGGRIIAGYSMGGYGAIKFGLKYSGMFRLAGSFSGALAITSRPGFILKMFNDELYVSTKRAFGTPNSKTRNTNDLFKIIEAKTEKERQKLPFLYVDCGTEDLLIEANRNFASLLLKNKIQHEFRQLPGRHNWKLWDVQIQEFLRVTDKLIK